jgi:hypothetical protein
MFCVIQKVVNKQLNPYGTHKELLVDSFTYSIGNESPKTKYTYRYSQERFERPILDAYKISIHKSYRENGKVKKKQWSICTMTYYNLIEFGPADCVNSKKLREKLVEIGITEEELWDMVYGKLDPITEAVKNEYGSTEEHQTKKKHDEILKKYREAKDNFEKKYGSDTYEYCYDVFGELRNPDYLKKVKEQHEAQKEYQDRSYYSYEQSNYSNYQSSSYFSTQQSAYTDENKIKLKKIFKTLSLKFHPDVTKDDGEMMKFINKLKEDWRI